MADKREVKLGTRLVNFPSTNLQPLQDCNHLLDDVQTLRSEMDEKGYLFIRGLHDRQEILDARLEVLKYLENQQNDILDSSHPTEAGVLQKGCGVGCLPIMEGRNDITHSDAVRKVIEGHRPFTFFKKYFGGRDVRTLDYKWLRVVPNNEFTGAHVDNVYMSRGSKELLTMWTPLGDINIEMGVLAMCEGSHNLKSFQKLQDCYGNLDVEAVRLKGTGWFTTDPFEITNKFGGQWKTIDFKAGDVMIFTMRTLHMSTVNQTDLARISCDTRWQPADDPVDSRYIGDCKRDGAKFGLYSSDSKQVQTDNTIEDYKIRWALN